MHRFAFTATNATRPGCVRLRSCRPNASPRFLFRKGPLTTRRRATTPASVAGRRAAIYRSSSTSTRTAPRYAKTCGARAPSSTRRSRFTPSSSSTSTATASASCACTATSPRSCRTDRSRVVGHRGAEKHLSPRVLMKPAASAPCCHPFHHDALPTPTAHPPRRRAGPAAASESILDASSLADAQRLVASALAGESDAASARVRLSSDDAAAAAERDAVRDRPLSAAPHHRV